MNGQPLPFDLQQMLQQQAGPGIPGMAGPVAGGGGMPPMPPGMGQPMGPQMNPGMGPGAMPPQGGNPDIAGQGQVPGTAPPPPGQPNQDQLMLDYLTTMGGLQPQHAEIARKRALVEQLRKGGQMGQMRNAGRMQVAQHPLEMLGALANTGVGAYKAQQADEDQAALTRKSDQAFADLRERSGVGK
jgi:hypothetical protein